MSSPKIPGFFSRPFPASTVPRLQRSARIDPGTGGRRCPVPKRAPPSQHHQRLRRRRRLGGQAGDRHRVASRPAPLMNGIALLAFPRSCLHKCAPLPRTGAADAGLVDGRAPLEEAGTAFSAPPSWIFRERVDWLAAILRCDPSINTYVLSFKDGIFCECASLSCQIGATVK